MRRLIIDTFGFVVNELVHVVVSNESKTVDILRETGKGYTHIKKHVALLRNRVQK